MKFMTSPLDSKGILHYSLTSHEPRPHDYRVEEPTLDPAELNVPASIEIFNVPTKVFVYGGWRRNPLQGQPSPDPRLLKFRQLSKLAINSGLTAKLLAAMPLAGIQTLNDNFLTPLESFAKKSKQRGRYSRDGRVIKKVAFKKASAVPGSAQPPQEPLQAFFDDFNKCMAMSAQVKSLAFRLLYTAKELSASNPSTLPLVQELEKLLSVPVTQAGQGEQVRATTDPLASARARGIQAMESEYKKTENLPLEESSVLAGCSERLLNERRQQGMVYALLPPGKSRGFRYPSWQFDADQARLTAALAPFFAVQANPWIIHNFMMRAHEELNGMRACDYILDASMPIATVVAAAEASLPTEQGAA